MRKRNVRKSMDSRHGSAASSTASSVAPLWFTRAMLVFKKNLTDELTRKIGNVIEKRIDKKIEKRMAGLVTSEEFERKTAGLERKIGNLEKRMSGLVTVERFEKAMANINKRFDDTLTRDEFNERMDDYPTKDSLLKTLDRYAGLVKKREQQDIIIDGTISRHEEKLHEHDGRIRILESASS